MAQTSDCAYHILESTYKQYMRLVTLKKANSIIANHIAHLSCLATTIITGRRQL